MPSTDPEAADEPNILEPSNRELNEVRVTGADVDAAEDEPAVGGLLSAEVEAAVLFSDNLLASLD